VRNIISAGVAVIVLLLAFSSPPAAGPGEDGLAAYQRGDYALALRLWQPLADRGDAVAQNNLGVLYANGSGVPQDWLMAITWYQKAADQGYATAQYNLGVRFADGGHGILQNYVRAYYWLNLAAAAGIKDAASARDTVAAKMTQTQIAEALGLPQRPVLKQVQEAERRANLATCMTGRYPNLCRKELLTSQETERVVAAERSANLEVCLSGLYPNLCRKNWLTGEQSQRVAEAERRALNQSNLKGSSQGVSRSPPIGSRTACEDGHWIDEVLADGKIIKLEDGTIWRVDDIDTITSSLWLPISEITICGGKLINTDDNESVYAHRME
jgi:TPR repeat protein